MSVGIYWIVSGDESEEMFASLRLGDNQRRRNYEIWLREYTQEAEGKVSKETFKVTLRVDGIERSGEGVPVKWKIKAIALCPGKVVKVHGVITFFPRKVKGDLFTVRLMRCNRCTYRKHTADNRCKECGEQLEIVDIPTLR